MLKYRHPVLIGGPRGYEPRALPLRHIGWFDNKHFKGGVWRRVLLDLAKGFGPVSYYPKIKISQF